MGVTIVLLLDVCPERSILIFPHHSFSQKGLGASLLPST